jgi:NAD(P)-dependent dehydrogenase (short-subunit alcohol dehydrogenase family)
MRWALIRRLLRQWRRGARARRAKAHEIMKRIFITGSSDGLGRAAAQLLVEQGHAVVLHARDAQRGAEAMVAIPGAETVVTADLSSIAQTRGLADKVNALGTFDAVIHNAGIGPSESHRTPTEDDLPLVFAVNTLAPYILTALITKPTRLVYLSSGLHTGGDATLNDLSWKKRAWNGMHAYSDTKLQDVVLAFAVARLWPDVCSNALEPGWVATKMGGPGAPDDPEKGRETQVWLAASDEPGALVTGKYFRYKRQKAPHRETHATDLQDRLLRACRAFSKVDMPGFDL